MGKKGGARKLAAPNVPFVSHNCISLREATSTKKQGKGGSAHSAKSLLKLEHLQKLSVWASKDASFPSMAAFFGHRFAAAGEALGVPPDPSLVSCQRCETILQPGFNCSVRIEKNRAMSWGRSKKANSFTKNNVVYMCLVCSHRNLKRGTPKGYVKEICPPKAKPLKSKPAKSMIQKSASSDEGFRSKDEVFKTEETSALTVSENTPTTNSPTTPLLRSGPTLLDGSRRKRNRSASKRSIESESESAPIGAERTVSASSKRRRKSWTSLKEIAESSDHDNSQNIANLMIPFFI